jgi:hypothetical protein
MLWDKALSLDFSQLAAYPDDCSLVALPISFIALLQSLLRFADGSPHLWRDVAGKKDPKWQTIKQYIANGRACLLMGCNVMDLNNSLKAMVGVQKQNLALQKYLVAALTDGKVRDFYPDPANLTDFAIQISVPVADLPTADLDGSWPGLDRFDALGSSRKAIDEVPSVWISQGVIQKKSMADMYADAMYDTSATDPTQWIGQTNAITDKMDALLKAIKDCCASGDNTGLQQSIANLSTQVDCLASVGRAINEVQGGKEVGDCGDPSVPADCQAVASAVDALIKVLGWEVYAVNMLGTVLNFTGVAPLVEWLVAQKWYITALGAAGLVDPLPDEIITLPAEIIEWTTVAVEALVTNGVDLNTELVDNLALHRKDIIDQLCGATDTNVNSKIDDVIKTIKDVFTDAAKKGLIQDVLQKFLKSPVAEGVILTK